jgi:PAS domain S-box-containing protein
MATRDQDKDVYKNQLEQLKRVQDAGKVGLWAVNAGEDFLNWTAETYKMFGLPIDTPITYKNMLNFVHPEDQAWVDEKWQAATKNGEYAVVYRIISAEKQIKWIEVFGDVVFDDAGNFVSALGIVRDVTEQKNAETRLKALTSSLKRSQKIGKLGSWIVKSSSQLVEMNEEAKAMFDIAKEETVSIDEWLGIIHHEDRDRVADYWSKIITQKGDFMIEYRVELKNSIKWIQGLGKVELNSNGEFEQAVGVVKDISEHKTQQEDLRLAKEEAERANTLKSQFLANMSHEIRTPLNGIIGFSEILMKTQLDEVQGRYMKTINQSAHILIDIINDILDFSKIEAGKLDLAQEKVDLQELAQQVKELISIQVKHKDVEIWVKTGSNLPQFVLTDGLRLQQVLVNLMSNALKFTEQGEIELSMQLLKASSPDQPIFRFSVRDTGIGISPENQSKIFKAFTQEDFSTSRKFGGTGLGLSISNGILAMMGSKLQLESEKGKGSVFYFDVPLQPSQPDKAQTNLSAVAGLNHKKPPEQDFKSLALKILIVDDNEINIFLARTLIKGVLPKSTILEAQEGQTAVEYFDKQKPDLILMDVQMPVMNGYDATKQIRTIEAKRQSSNELNQRTPIIGVTAGIMEGEKRRCLAAGMDEFLEKPIMADKLKALVLEWISSTVKD